MNEFRIVWKNGERISGVLPEIFDTREEAQEQCDLENKEYNSVCHTVVEVKCQ